MGDSLARIVEIQEAANKGIQFEVVKVCGVTHPFKKHDDGQPRTCERVLDENGTHEPPHWYTVWSTHEVGTDEWGQTIHEASPDYPVQWLD